MIWKRPSKIQTFLLIGSVFVTGLGSWKWYQDRDDVAYAHAQIQENRMRGVESPNGDVVENGLTTAVHRDSLLTISREERLLREMEAKGVKASSLRESIERDVEKLLSSEHSRSVPPGPEANVMEYYTKWERDAHDATTVDLCIIGASIFCAACTVCMWLARHLK